MTITPRWVAGGEVTQNVEFEIYSGAGPTNNAIFPFTGARAFAQTSVGVWGSPAFPASTHMRMGFYFRHGSFSGSATTVAEIFGRFTSASTSGVIFGLARQPSTGNIIPIINDVQQTAIGDHEALGFTALDTYYHMGLLCQIGSPGYAAVFVDQHLVWDYTGAITGTMQYAQFRTLTANMPGTNSRYDDIYADDISGEANSAPPPYRFPVRFVNGAGADAQWTPSAGANYQNVDDGITPDFDTTYNYSEVNGQKDTFAAGSLDEWAGHHIVARHPFVIARRTGAEGEIKIHTLGGATYKSSAAIELQTAYKRYMTHQTSMPDNSPFSTTAALAATEIGYESAGFS